MSFEKYLSTKHIDTDYWSCRIRDLVNIVYNKSWSPHVKPLLTKFTTYVYWNFNGLGSLDEEEVVLLTHHFIEHKIHYISRQRVYKDLKQFLCSLDENELKEFIDAYDELCEDHIYARYDCSDLFGGKK